MGLYRKYVLPRIVHKACQCKPALRQRKWLIPKVEGRVLEIGFGSGLNIPHYRAEQINRLWALEPSEKMIGLASPLIRSSKMDIRHLSAGAEAIPLESHCVDTVVSTYTLCTIRDTTQAFNEIRRVLKPGGRLLFCEHGLAPDSSVRWWQHRLNPIWSRLGGGCQLNRDIPKLLEEGGFDLEQLDAMYIPGWKIASFNFRGWAVCT